MGGGVGGGGEWKVGEGCWGRWGHLVVAKWCWVRDEGCCELGVTVMEVGSTGQGGWWWAC